MHVTVRLRFFCRLYRIGLLFSRFHSFDTSSLNLSKVYLYMEHSTSNYNNSTDKTKYKSSNGISGQDWKDKRWDVAQGYSFWVGTHPIRCFGGISIPNNISNSDMGLLFKCAMMLDTDTNMIVKHNSNGLSKSLNATSLAKQLGISVRQCQYFIQRMVAKGVIKREQKRMYINPLCFIRGRYLSWHLYNLFRSDLDHVLPQWVIDRFNEKEQ